MDLTIIVTTIPERRQLLGRCLWYLEHQSCKTFEVLIAHGPRPKGDKVNLALSLATTTHVMMVDDDDWISERLVASVLPYNTDYVGYNALQMVNGRYNTIIHQETASHICPIRTDLARQIPFGNDYLDDIIWTKQVAQLVETETYLDDTFYYYDKWNPVGQDRWSPPRQVGYWPHNKMRENFQWI
jgi:hypothetical protein